jgi:hypothetical protein
MRSPISEYSLVDVVVARVISRHGASFRVIHGTGSLVVRVLPAVTDVCTDRG